MTKTRSQQRRAGRSSPAGGRGGLFCLALCLALVALAPAAAWAGIIFTPSISAGVGYDDNVRQQKARRGDGFVTTRPAATLEAGKPNNLLQVSASAQFDKYYRLRQYDGFQNGDITARWRYLPSRIWAFEVYNAFSSSYDQEEIDETGGFTRVRPASGRRDRNTTGFRVTRLMGPGGSQLTAGYSYSITRNENPTLEDQATHHADLGLTYRLSPRYRASLFLTGDQDDYERSSDVQRGTAEARMAYLFNSHDEVWAGGVVGGSRSLSDSGSIREGRDYTYYSPRLGFKKAFSPKWELEGYGGVTYVEGEKSANSASGEYAPVGSLQLTYREKLWLFRISTLASMDENQSLGQNTGLVDRKQVSASLDARPAARWRLGFGADWVRDDYKQNQRAGISPTTLGYAEYWRFYSLASYQLTQHWSVKLDYRYLTRGSENDTDNLEQNRVVLSMDYELPFRW